MVQCQTEKLESLESLVIKLITANSSLKLNNQFSTNGIADRPPPGPASHHPEDYRTSRDFIRVNTLVEEIQCPKDPDTQS